MPPAHHLSLADEKAEYDLHQNSPADQGYRRFLSRVANPLLERLDGPSCGLDFGCGPGPTLSVILAEAGHQVALYDPFYAPNTTPLSPQYDFVTATEVVEHFRDPATDLECLWACVRPGGLLGLMTKLARDPAAVAKTDFSTWHYKNDPTHVSFFSQATFQWLAQQWGATVDFYGSDVILMTKNCHTQVHLRTEV